MKKPFTEEEIISMISKKLKNGQSPGIYNMYVEYSAYKDTSDNRRYIEEKC